MELETRREMWKRKLARDCVPGTVALASALVTLGIGGMKVWPKIRYVYFPCSGEMAFFSFSLEKRPRLEITFLKQL